jgi:uncharacterized membrane protein
LVGLRGPAKLGPEQVARQRRSGLAGSEEGRFMQKLVVGLVIAILVVIPVGIVWAALLLGHANGEFDALELGVLVVPALIGVALGAVFYCSGHRQSGLALAALSLFPGGALLALFGLLAVIAIAAFPAATQFRVRVGSDGTRQVQRGFSGPWEDWPVSWGGIVLVAFFVVVVVLMIVFLARGA